MEPDRLHGADGQAVSWVIDCAERPLARRARLAAQLDPVEDLFCPWRFPCSHRGSLADLEGFPLCWRRCGYLGEARLYPFSAL